MFKKIMEVFENLFVAISFAEAGEFDTVREILRERRIDRQSKRVRPEQGKRIQMRV